ncbi:WSSV468 [White spot syndrome virus]|uniref:WSSV468 n=1 Tax=White spot syndrome virus TaxID=342409 RepID=A0A2I6SCE6_9VIRU|nr:WSSV468 [White spot syndrome virus]
MKFKSLLFLSNYSIEIVLLVSAPSGNTPMSTSAKGCIVPSLFGGNGPLSD